jgi:hypothetical protein
MARRDEIGGGGGRFEILYMEVLPLLPEMLENLNRQLLVSALDEALGVSSPRRFRTCGTRTSNLGLMH